MPDRSLQEHWYTTERYPHFVCAWGRNWGLWSNGAGHLASIPTRRGRKYGCKASHFGDFRYFRSLGIPPDSYQWRVRK